MLTKQIEINAERIAQVIVNCQDYITEENPPEGRIRDAKESAYEEIVKIIGVEG